MTRHLQPAWLLSCGLVLVLGAPCAASHGAPENLLPVAKGVYRLPFDDGTVVAVSGDHITHSPHNRIDMSPTDNSVAHNILAAGDGVIEYLQDSFDLTCPRVTATNPNPCQNYNGPSGSCCVRGTRGCNAMCRNNYVWIRHPNGEWSKYTHMRVNSIPGNLVVGQAIAAGTVLGVEGDVGFANGVHLHFEVGVPDTIDASVQPGAPGYDPLGISPATCGVCGLPNAPGDDALVNNGDRQNRIPVFCGIGFLSAGNNVEAEACDGQCAFESFVLGGSIDNDEIFHRQATDGVGNDGNAFTVQPGGGAAMRAGDIVRLTPGFRARSGSFFSASIGACDSPGF